MKRLFFAIILGLVAYRADAQVSISASSVRDSFNTPVAAARLCFMPVNAAMQPSGFRVGSTQVVPNEVCGSVTNGVLASGKTLAPSPTGLYYHIYLKPPAANTIIRDYGMTPITGSTWTMDTYDPATMAVLPQAITMGAVTTVPPGSYASCTISGNSPYALNCQIPQATGGGLVDPGSNGLVKRTALNLTGVAGYADVVGLWPSCTSGYLKYDGTCSTPSGSGGMTYPSVGLGASTGSAWRSPTFSDVVTLWASGSCTTGYLKYDGTCSTPSGTGGGVSDPGSNGIMKRTALNTTAVASVTDLVALWASGSCNGYLKSDGTCNNPGGASYTAGQGVSTTSNILSTTGVTTSQIVFSNSNSLTSAMQLVAIPSTFAYTLPTNGLISSSSTTRNATSQLLLQTLPTATWTVTLYKYPAGTAGCLASSPSSIGTVAVATSGAQTWAVTQTSFAIGDCLVVVAPAVVDTSASGVYGAIAVVD